MAKSNRTKSRNLTLFLAGDVMTGRGIDQALPQSVDPVLYETYIKDARNYLWLAEQENGPVDVPVSYDYIWGDALRVWEENAPDMKLINLETSITTHPGPWPGKGINYRMHPGNVRVLTAAGIDHCSLANNHTLDWGRKGLEQTMESLENAGIRFSGAGGDEKEAAEGSVMETENGRVLVFSFGLPDSGIPAMWAAQPGLSGINFLPAMGEKEIQQILSKVNPLKKKEDIVVFSVHWGDNWGYAIPYSRREFAHRLIDEGGADIIYGHSSHHPLGIEVYKEKLIIYGAGDFINDYEGISGHRQYRGELTLMYFPQIKAAGGELKSLKLVPMEMKKFRLNRVSRNDALWLQEMLNSEGEPLGTKMHIDTDNSLLMQW